jgi:hypothetical protein
MNFSRRDFVKLGGIAAVTSLGFSSLAFGQKQGDILLQQTSESFRQLIGTEFYITGGDISTPATLKNVEDFPNKPDNGESFSLEFQIPLKHSKEDTYRVWHSDLGNFDLFLTEGRNGKSPVLFATINLI